MQSSAFLVTSAFSWFISFITRSLALRSATMIRPEGWCWMNCERSKQATARVLGSLEVSKIVIRTFRICHGWRQYVLINIWMSVRRQDTMWLYYYMITSFGRCLKALHISIIICFCYKNAFSTSQLRPKYSSFVIQTASHGIHEK